MQRQNRLAGILANKSGASLLFVLGIMLLLMAIGTSALAAASAAAGAGMNKQAGSQLNLYAESIHKSVMYSLQASKKLDGGKVVASPLPVSDAEKPETLGGQILAAAYQAAQTAFAAESDYATLAAYAYAGALTLDITPSLKDDTSEKLKGIYKKITLSIEPQVRIVKERDEEYFVLVGDTLTARTETIPREASVNALVMVIVTTEHQGKSLTSVAAYRCAGGFLKETAGRMRIENAGGLEWEFVSYEKYDS